MPTGGASNEAAATAAKVKPEKVGDDLSNDRHEAEPEPLPMEVVDPAPDMEAEEDIEEQFRCKEEVPVGEAVQCHADDCDKPAVRIWVGSVTTKEWPYCLSCEKDDFGDNVEQEWQAAVACADAAKNDPQVGKMELDQAATTKQGGKEAMVLESPFAQKQDVKEALLTPKLGVEAMDHQDQADGGDDMDEEDDAYELIDFVRFENLDTTQRLCSICADPDSSAKQLLACTIWQGSSDPKKYYYCIDCQEKDFGGFPTKEELIRHNALKNLDPATIQEHIRLMKTKCSRMRNPNVPDLASYLPSSVSGAGGGRSLSPKNNTNFVTPPPKSLASANCLTQASGAANRNGRSTKGGPTQQYKESKVALEKWKKEAASYGGNPDNLILEKKDANKVLFDTLYDAFAPMNITDLIKISKGEIPRFLLSTCLKDMSHQGSGNPFDGDSDDEDSGKKSTKKRKRDDDEDEPYGPGSLCVKHNRGPELYYTNHKKLKTLSHDERQELLSAQQTAIAKKEAMEHEIKWRNALTKELLSQPTNDELIGRLKDEEDAVASLRKMVEERKKYQVNESTRIDLQKKIQKMLAQWIKRKRMCESFLTHLEDVSEGAISRRKSLSGDGPLALDSDDIVEKAELQSAALKLQKRKMGRNPRGIPMKKIETDYPDDQSSPILVALRLGKGNKLERVFYPEVKED